MSTMALIFAIVGYSAAYWRGQPELAQLVHLSGGLVIGELTWRFVRAFVR